MQAAMKKLTFVATVIFSMVLSNLAIAENTYLPTNEKPLRIGAVGLGAHFKEKLLPAMTEAGFQWVAGSRRDSVELQKQKEEWNLEFSSTDYRDLIDSNLVDAIVVSGTPSLHEEVVRACLKAGIPVFAEKPLSISSNTAKELSELSLATGTVNSIGFNMIHIPSMESLQEKAKAGDLDNLEILCSIGDPYSDLSFKDLVKESLYFAFIHPLSFAIKLMGKPDSIETKFVSDKNEAKFELRVALVYDGTPKQTIVFKNRQKNGFVFKIEYYDKNNSLQKVDTTAKLNGAPSEKQISYTNEFRDFYKSIKSGKAPQNDLEFNYAVQEVLELVEDNLESIDLNSEAGQPEL